MTPCSLPGSSVYGILQARKLGWIAIPFSRGYSQPMDQTRVSYIGRWILYCLATWEALGSVKYIVQVKTGQCLAHTRGSKNICWINKIVALGKTSKGERWKRMKSVTVLVAQSCLTLCTPMDCSPPGSSVYGILQARKLEWDAMLSSRGSSPPRDWTCVSYVSCIGGFFITSA